MSETFIKAGEEWLRITLSTHRRGLLIEAKVHPLVEEFIKGMGDNKITLEEAAGRHNGWEAPSDMTALAVYRTDNVMRGESLHFNLSNIGSNLVDDNDRINLSWLRLVGIGEGVKFISTKECYPLEYRRQLRLRISSAFREFVREYIKTPKITLVMTGQEL